jgi:hypothetical protein
MKINKNNLKTILNQTFTAQVPRIKLGTWEDTMDSPKPQGII